MKIKISHLQNLNESQEFDLSLTAKKGKEWLIGRSPDSDVFLDSSDVSRLHGKFSFQGGNYYFSDLDSRNGSMVNGKLAEKNQAYILRDKDIIRIGDFVLMMEEMIPFSQQEETVVRIISPSQFSNWRSTENADNVRVENQTPQEVVTPVAEEVSQTPNQVKTPEVADNVRVENQTPQEVETPVAEEVSQTPNQVETPEVADNVRVENQTPQEVVTPVAEEVSQTPNQVETPEVAKADALKLDEIWPEVMLVLEAALIQLEYTASPAEAIATDESIIQQDEAARVASIISDEADYPSTPTEEQVAADVSSDIPEIERPDFTYVQPRDIIHESPEESTSQLASAVSDEDVDTATELTEDQATETIDDVTPDVILEIEGLDEIIIQPRDISDQLPEEQTAPDITDEPAEVIIVVAVEESEDLVLDNRESLPTTEVESTQVSEELQEAIISESESVNQTSEEVSATEEASISQYPESLAQKRIVLIAHESKKSELADFVAEYQKFFSVCHTLAWSSVSEVLHQQAGITISEQIPAGISGGYQLIASSIASGDISAVIFLRDFLQPQPGQANEDAMLRLCNINEALVATNVVTARAIVHYMTHIEERR